MPRRVYRFHGYVTTQADTLSTTQLAVRSELAGNILHEQRVLAGQRVHVVEVPDVRAIRRQLHMSQQRFAEAYRIPLPTLRNWEQGRRQPDAPAAAYLHAIAKRPREISEALS